jgi:hypothetical protein
MKKAIILELIIACLLFASVALADEATLFFNDSTQYPGDLYAISSSNLSAKYTVYSTLSSTINCTILIDNIASGSLNDSANNTLISITSSSQSSGVHNYTYNCTDDDWNSWGIGSYKNIYLGGNITLFGSTFVKAIIDNDSDGYFFMNNSVSDWNQNPVITIQYSNNTVLDMMNTTIDGTDASNSYGIYISSSNGTIVRNGTLSDYRWNLDLTSSNYSYIANVTSNSPVVASFHTTSNSHNTTYIDDKITSSTYSGILVESAGGSTGYNVIRFISSSTGPTGTGGIIKFDTGTHQISDSSFSDGSLGNAVQIGSKSGGINMSYSNITDFAYCFLNTFGFSNISSSRFKCTTLKGFDNGKMNFYDNVINATTYSVSGDILNTTLTAGINIMGFPWIGGNYWTNSNKNGYSDTCADADGDGICDNSYTVDTATDYLPLSMGDNVPPAITITSPQNTTYSRKSNTLNFTTSEPISWSGYSLDDGNNVTITKNTTLYCLTNGSHNVIVYANDTSSNMGASDKVYFTIDTLLGDVDGICDTDEYYKVNILDLSQFGKAFGSIQSSTNWDPFADLSCNGAVDVFDLFLIGRNYGTTKTCTQPIGQSNPVTTLHVEPENALVSNATNTTFDVNVSVDQVDNLYAFGFRLEYDPNVLGAINIVSSYLNTPVWTGKKSIDNSKGEVELEITSWIGAMPKTGKGSLATVTFRVKDFGRSNLDLYNTKLANYDIKPISHNITDGLFINYLPVNVSINPNILNLKSSGNWITAYINLPLNYNVSNIDMSSVNLWYQNNYIPTSSGLIQNRTLMTKFDRTSLKGLSLGNIMLTVTGKVLYGNRYLDFKGMDTIKVMNK